jgi:putative transposase
LGVVPNHPHHIIHRGNNRRRLFSYPRDHRFFLSCLSHASERFGVPVHSNVQMSNHVHLIATPTDQTQLSSFVQSFAQRYAQYRNRHYRATGKLFEERFKCIPILSDEHMAVTTAYVELNPVRAGMSRRAIEYRWSTFAMHVGVDPEESLIRKLWTPSRWFLSLGADLNDRCAAFEDWFLYYRARADWKEVYRPTASSDSPDSRHRRHAS